METSDRRPIFPLLVALSAVLVVLAALVPVRPSGAQTTSTTPTTTPVRSAECADRPSRLGNAGFEGPVVPDATARIADGTTVPSWASPRGRLTLASTGFEGIAAATGRQFLQLLDASSTSVHQDVATGPGETLAWSLAHRALTGSASIEVRLGAPGEPGEVRATLRDGEAWTRHSGTYVVPDGQTITRLTIEADAGSGGNLLDDVSFGSASCLFVTSEMTPDGAIDVESPLTQRVVVRNVGGAPTTEASVIVTPPTALEYLTDSAIPAGVWNFIPDSLIVPLVGASGVTGVILPGEAVTASWQWRVKPEAADNTLQLDVTASSSDALGGPRRATSSPEIVDVRPSADVQLSQSFTPALVAPGAATTLQFGATNLGPSTATGVTVWTDLPAGLTVDSGSVPEGCRLAGRTITCAVGALPKDGSRTWSVGATAPSSTGVVHAAVAVEATTHDPSYDNGALSTALSVGPPAGAQLDLQVNRSPLLATAGDITTIVADVTNVGSAPTAGPVIITNGTPEPFVNLFLVGTTPPSSSPTTCDVATATCTVAALAPGQSVRLDFRGTVRPETDDGASIAGSVRAASAGVTTVGADLTIAVSTLAALTLSEVSAGPPDVATPVTKVVTVTNAGPSFAKATEIFVPVPERTTTVSRPSDCTESFGGWLCRLGDILSGRPANATFILSLPTTGAVVTDRAWATTSTPTNGPVTDRLPQRWVAAAAADLAPSIIGLPPSVTTGDLIETTISVRNDGPGDANDVIVTTDPQRNGLRVVDAIPTVGTVDTGGSTWSIPSLAAGASTSMTLVLTATRDGEIDLAAIASSRTPDLDGTDTTAIASAQAEGRIVEPASEGSSPWPWILAVVVLLAASSTGAAVLLRRRRRR